MRIYKFPAKPLSAIEFQPIDLDYIVSIGPVTSSTFHRHNMYGESFCSFTIYIKVGQPIPIEYMSSSYSECPSYVVEALTKEREKLIEAWKEKETYNATT